MVVLDAVVLWDDTGPRSSPGNRGRLPPRPGTSVDPRAVSSDCVNISAPTTATTENPMVKSGGNSTPSAPPKTHASCSAVSERPNADDRAASGISVWMEESNATLPSALAIAATNANTAAIQMVPTNAATTAAESAAPAETVAMRPGLPRGRRDPTAFPTKVPMPPAAPAMASNPACSIAVASS